MKKIALPVSNNVFCSHFGGAEKFIVFEVDEEKKEIISFKEEPPPPHQPGTFPKFLKSLEVDVVLAGNMGQKAFSMFKKFGIEVLLGIQTTLDPKNIINEYLHEKLQATNKSCSDHSFHHCH
ncbi:MAG: NifB/NifX family molybdenum-iron cluster-binding protein [Thermoanaerobaculaceae bacterium]